MRVLLGLTIAVLLPSAAQARPVCGPAKETTLAANATARLYETTTARATTLHGCARGKRPFTLGTRVRAVRLTGTFAAVVHHEALTVYDLRGRRAVGAKRRNEPGAKVRGFAIDRIGHLAWIEDYPGGTRALRAPNGVVADAGRDIHPAFVNVGDGLISYRKGEYVKFADDHLDEYAAALPPKVTELGRVGDVRLSTERGSLYATQGSGTRVKLGGVLDDGNHVGGEGQRFGVGALRVAGAFVAVRENILSLGPFASGSVRVYALDGSEPPRELCGGERVNDFIVTPAGAVACVTSGPTIRVLSEGALLDEGDTTIRDLEIQADQLAWKHGAEPRSAPLPTRNG